MAAFPTDATTTHPHDFAIARCGGVALYLRDDVLLSSERELDALGYDRVQLTAAHWRDEGSLHEDFATALNFPDYYGHNMNALADCLHDVACADYGWDPARTGLATTITGFGAFVREQPRLAHDLVERLVAASADAMLFGHRLLWLLHVDDPDLQMAPVGAVPVLWNDQEWLDANRR